MSWDGTVPYSKINRKYLDYDDGSDYWYRREDIEYRPMREPFYARLEFVSGRRGRSATRFEFLDENGDIHTTAFGTMLEMIPRMNHGVIEGRWRYTKRGANYQFEPVDETTSS